MKFLCLECDTAMKFKESKTPEGGTLTAIFECPGLLWGNRDAYESVGDPNAQIP